MRKLLLSALFLLAISTINLFIAVPQAHAEEVKVKFQENLILVDQEQSCWNTVFKDSDSRRVCRFTQTAGGCGDVNGHKTTCWSNPEVKLETKNCALDPKTITGVQVSVLPIAAGADKGKECTRMAAEADDFPCGGENNCTWNVISKDGSTTEKLVLIQADDKETKEVEGFPTVFQYDLKTQSSRVLPREEWEALQGKFSIVDIYGDCEGEGEIDTALGCVPVNDTNLFVAFVLRWAIGVGGGVAFLLMLYAGFQIMTASGNPDRLQAGRELLTAAISGLILIIFSVFLLRLIGVQILHLPGLGGPP